MAHYNDPSYGPAASAPPRRGQRLTHWMGALTSVGLVVGFGYWAFNLAMHDVNGVPVIRAPEGAMRLAPEDPGGVITTHQGFSVNSVAEVGSTLPPADQLMLAPPPMSLMSEDIAGLHARVLPQEPAAAAVATPAAPSPEAVVRVMDATVAEASEPEPIAVDDPPAEAPVLAEDAVMAALAEALEVDDLSEAAPSAAVVRPRARPQQMAAAAPAEAGLGAATTPVSVVGAELDGESLPAGTRLVQLGAFESADIARNEWQRLSGRFGELLNGKTRIVQAAQSGGREFWRLRASGFADEAEQRRFCSALVAENAACVPVTVR